jgi:hypothetical protein
MTLQQVLPSGVTLQRRAVPADPADLPPHVLERLALRWAAERADVPPGRVVMREEELGWGIEAPGAAGGYATFIDKVTGRVVGFANPTYLNDQYREQLEHERGLLPRPGFGGPEVETPGTVAEVAVESFATVRAASVRTYDPPVLHPLVQARLDAIPARERVRGAEWHPELTALGKVVQSLGDPGASVRLWLVREPADPAQGVQTVTPCATCARVLGLPPGSSTVPSRWERMRRRRELHRRAAPPPERVAERIEEVLAVRGVYHRHTASPAALEALGRYLDADWSVEVPGRSVRTTAFHIDPAWAADTTDTLARVSKRVGAPLFPLGTAGHDGFLAVDTGGRVYLIDATGEWLLGTGLPAALDTLLLGRTATRVRHHH